MIKKPIDTKVSNGLLHLTPRAEEDDDSGEGEEDEDEVHPLESYLKVTSAYKSSRKHFPPRHRQQP